MYNVSTKFTSIMSSNIRPKTDFKITVTGNGNTLEWTAKDITNFTFKRGIDPIGRNLPFLELTWEEIYLGELNTQNEATKYNNVTPYMKVELSIEQSLQYINTWKDVYSLTWADIFNSGKTWRDILKKTPAETIKMPTMFLVAKPEVKNQKIVWTARDFLYFLNATQEIGFKENIPFANPMRYFLLDERANFKTNYYMVEEIMSLQTELKDYFLFKNETIPVKTLFNSNTKNILKNHLASASCFLNLTKNGATVEQIFGYLSTPTPFRFTGNIMKEFPKMTKGKNISAFSFTQYNVKLDEASKYTLSTPDETFENLNGTTVYRYFYKDFGMIEITDANSGKYPPKTINKNVLTALNPINVIPVSLNTAEIFVNNNKDGEQYAENNPCNFYGLNSAFINGRKTELDKWFSENKYTMEFEGLPALHIEPFDYVEVETNLFKNKTRIIKIGVVLEQELTFNGGFSQKTIVREV